VHVHVDAVRRQRQEKQRRGKATARQHVAIDLDQRVLDQPVAHEPPVYEEVDAGHGGSVPVGTRHESLQSRGPLLAFCGQQRRGLLLAQHGGHAVQQRARRWPDERRPVVAPDLEMHLRQRQGDASEPVGDVPPLGVDGLEELAAGRNAREELGDLHAGPLGASRRLLVGDAPFLDAKLEGLRRSAGPGAQPQVRDRGDGRKRLAAESVGRDPLEVIAREDLAGGVALQRQASVLRRHAAAVVGHRDPVPAPGPHLHPQLRSPRIEGILDQLLDHGGRTFHHLSRRDLIDQGVGQRPNAPRHAFGSSGHFSPRLEAGARIRPQPPALYHGGPRSVKRAPAGRVQKPAISLTNGVDSQ
jgi:hypothetical protein